MKLEIPTTGIINLVRKQLDHLFAFDPAAESQPLERGVREALDRCDVCFAATGNKYYRRDGDTYFSPWHSGQYSIFLYFLSHAVFRHSGSPSGLADRIYYLNKALNGLDLYYEVRMPDVFHLDHPVGSVLGRAEYGELFSFSQNCTVGNNRGKYPRIGTHVKMMSGSKILGDCTIGDHVILSANSFVKEVDIPPYSLVFGSGRDLVVKCKDEAYFREHNLL